MRRQRFSVLVPAALAGLAMMATAGCAGGHTRATVQTGRTVAPAGASTSSAPPATTVAGQVPTVPDCGAGAFEPATLHIVCGVDTTMATGVTWQSWGATAAEGTGTVRLASAGMSGSGAARLSLSQPVSDTLGTQFSRLTVTWTGKSPDGHHSDVFRLGTGS
ncbi:MAG: hypothetical protein ACRDYY_04360 [Acidimicrobiales bacterium]